MKNNIKVWTKKSYKIKKSVKTVDIQIITFLYKNSYLQNEGKGNLW